MTRLKGELWFSPLNPNEVNEAPIKNVKFSISESMTSNVWMNLSAEEREAFWMGSYWIRVKVNVLTREMRPVYLSDIPRDYLTKAMKG